MPDNASRRFALLRVSQDKEYRRGWRHSYRLYESFSTISRRQELRETCGHDADRWGEGTRGEICTRSSEKRNAKSARCCFSQSEKIKKALARMGIKRMHVS